MSRRSLAAAVTALLLAAACGVPTDAQPRPLPHDRVPFDLLSPELAPPTTVRAGGDASPDP